MMQCLSIGLNRAADATKRCTVYGHTRQAHASPEDINSGPHAQKEDTIPLQVVPATRCYDNVAYDTSGEYFIKGKE